MATENGRTEDELVAARKAMWGSFTKVSTYVIVGVAALLILMVIFLV